MESRYNKRHIIIASKVNLIRLGIKSILSMLNFDAELYDVDDFKKIKDSLITNSSIDFIILSEDIFPKGEPLLMSQIAASTGNANVMLIGNSDFKMANLNFVDACSDHSMMLEHFRNFFGEQPANLNNEETLLTEREIEVLRKVAQGNANKEIADKLFISINTVITHRKNITEKLGIKTIPGLTVYAIMNGVINPEDVKY